MPPHKNVNFEKEMVLLKHSFQLSFRQHLLAYLSISPLDELPEEEIVCLVYYYLSSTFL